jgi:glycosyltransferase involved in cell wall biosynthesis
MKSKKTILYLTYSSGGPRVWAQNLAREMEKRGWKTEIAWGEKNYLIKPLKHYDVIHSAFPIIYCFSPRYILTIHGNYKAEKYLLSKILFPLAEKRSDVLTTPSLFIKKGLRIDSMLVVPNGINMPEHYKINYGILDNFATFGILTNFNFKPKARGVWELSKILAKISPQGKLIVGGTGQYFNEYKNQILNNYPNTKFIGHCRKEDLFSQIDIFTYYSLLDNQPLALMEAMAFGLPVLSNDVGAVREIMTGDMEKYIANDEVGYANLLNDIINSEENRTACGRLARETVGQFSWSKIADIWEEIYNDN